MASVSRRFLRNQARRKGGRRRGDVLSLDAAKRDKSQRQWHGRTWRWLAVTATYGVDPVHDVIVRREHEATYDIGANAAKRAKKEARQ